MQTKDFIAAGARPFRSRILTKSFNDRLFSSTSLPFTMEYQPQSNWCWAATSKSVSHYYWSSSSWTQCSIASAELGRSDCCNSSVPSQCNVTWYLDRALTRTRNLRQFLGQVTFQQVQSEINAGRPVGVRTGWAGGGGHFLVIYGYAVEGTTSYFHLADPIYGVSKITVNDFAVRYQGSGTWTHTYFTQSYAGMRFKVSTPDTRVLDAIWHVRPLLHEHQSQDSEAGTDTRAKQHDLGAMLEIYTLGLASLLNEGAEARPVASLSRVYEMHDSEFIAFYDVLMSGDGLAHVTQMSDSETHMRAVRHAFDTAFSDGGDAASEAGAETEVGIFRVPALNFEALWLRGDSKDTDVLIPLRPFGELPPYRKASYADVLPILKTHAVAIRQDDTSGG